MKNMQFHTLFHLKRWERDIKKQPKNQKSCFLIARSQKSTLKTKERRLRFCPWSFQLLAPTFTWPLRHWWCCGETWLNSPAEPRTWIGRWWYCLSTTGRLSPSITKRGCCRHPPTTTWQPARSALGRYGMAGSSTWTPPAWRMRRRWPAYSRASGKKVPLCLCKVGVHGAEGVCRSWRSFLHHVYMHSLLESCSQWKRAVPF